MLHFPTATGWLIDALAIALGKAEAEESLPVLPEGVQRPVHVSSSIPPTLKQFVRLWRSGGFREGVLDHAVFIVEFWDVREDYSEAGATYVRDLLYSWRGGLAYKGVQVKEIENSGLAILPDPNRPELARTTFTATMVLRGTMTE